MIGITNFDYADSEHKELMANFFLLGEKGKTLAEDSSGHLDGWGVGYYKEGKAFVRKSAGSIVAEKNRYFKILEKIGKSPVLIAHFRKSAWPDTNTVANSHPFEHKNILFAHNGTIYDYEKLIGQIEHKDRLAHKVLDSEMFARFIVTRRTGNLKKKLSQAISVIRENNKYSSLNCLLTDGKNLYAYREYTKNPEYYTLFSARSGKSKIYSSEEVSEKLDWEIFPPRHTVSG